MFNQAKRLIWVAFDKREFTNIFKLAFLTTCVVVCCITACAMALAFLFGISRVSEWMFRLTKWPFGSTAINYMQSMFQLGAATSIAFAIAGPQIQHALGPRAQSVIRHVRLANNESSEAASKLRNLADILLKFDAYEQDYWSLGRGNLYKLHFSMALINFVMLSWSSLIDPRGRILNGIAFLVIISSMFIPLIDLSRTYIEARRIRPMLQEAKNACDSGRPDRIDAICAKIEAEIKPLPPNI